MLTRRSLMKRGLAAGAVATPMLWTKAANGARVNAARRLGAFAPDGAWCWFADPRGLTFQGRLVLASVDSAGSVQVSDGRDSFTLAEHLQRDDHSNPALYIRKDGRLTAFWSAHLGSQMYYRTASRGIVEWDAPRTVPVNATGPLGYTYPNPIRVNGRLHLFWRGADSRPTLAVSPDDGDTWGAAGTLIDAPNGYVKYARSGNDVHIAWSPLHPRLGSTGIYHAILRHGSFYTVAGKQLGALDDGPLPADGGTPVYRPYPGAWIHDLRVEQGKPQIAYATFPTLSNHAYRFASWSGRRWRDELVTRAGPSFNPDQVVPEPWYSGGISIGRRGVYLSRQVSGQFEIEYWTRGQEGWSRARRVTHNSGALNVRPYAVNGGVAWMRGRYDGFENYATRLLWQPAFHEPEQGAATERYMLADALRLGAWRFR
jgi:hypothetical protein